MTKEQKETAEFIRSKKLNVKVTFNGYMPLIDAFLEFAQTKVKKLILHDVNCQRELLIAYEIKMTSCSDRQAERKVDSYLASKSN